MAAEWDRNTIILVMAADEGFALPLAVTMRSLLETLAPHHRIHLFLLDGGIAPATFARLNASWDGYRVTTTVIKPEFERLKHAPVSGHVNHGTYFRLLIPELLPQDIPEVIYLDADLLVRRDIGNLWEEPIGEAWCLAVQDCAAPYMNAREMLSNDERCAHLLAAVTPIPNYRELGLSGKLPYFNGGVLRINLSAWRDFDLTNRLLACLRTNADSLLWWDQYALNVVLAGHWRPLDLRWNQGSRVFRYPNWPTSPFQREEFENLRTDPWIVHFTSPVKPWHAWCRHPYRGEFLAVLDRTDWKGTRPPIHEYVTRACSGSWGALKRLRVMPLAARTYRRLFVQG